MLKKILLLAVVGVMLSGCFMSPLAFIGPATSGFSTASLMQTGATSTANYLIKKSTGKTIARHVYDVIEQEALKSAYLPAKIEKLNTTKIKKLLDWLRQ